MIIIQEVFQTIRLAIFAVAIVLAARELSLTYSRQSEAQLYNYQIINGETLQKLTK